MKRPNFTLAVTALSSGMQEWIAQLVQRTKRIARAIHGLFALCFVLACSSAAAQTIDTIDVVRREAAAEIHISFSTQIQYTRHVPQNTGSTIRIYIQTLGFNMEPASPVPYSRDIRGEGIFPNATVTYTENQNLIQLNFSSEVQFSVRPGNDARSIVVIIPSAKGG